MMKPDRYAPPGFNWQRELRWICAGLSVAILYSMKFFINYQRARNALYERAGHIKRLYKGLVIADFHIVVSNCLMIFPVVVLCLIAIIFLRYAYHYQDAKSIYLMQRLPSRWELHIRCIIMPLVAILTSLLIALILLLIYYGVYVILTPDVCLMPNQWAKLWNAWRN